VARPRGGNDHGSSPYETEIEEKWVDSLRNRKEDEMKSRAALSLAVAVVSAAIFASAAFATVVHYYGPGWVMNNNQVAETSGFANRDYNKMFRNGSGYIAVQYNDTGGGFLFGDSGYGNPVQIGASGQLAKAKCGNLSGGLIYNTTCNTTT
jgi:hypothetical protein